MFPRPNPRPGATAAALLMLLLPAAALAQAWPRILEGAELERVVPQGFYFEGQSGATQMRNAAAAQLGPRRFVMAGLVDTSGYSSDVQAKYQGFIVTDSPITVGGSRLPTGAYGFGFTPDGWLNVMDVGGRRVLSVRARNDERLQRPRPLMMTDARNGVRLYSGRSFVVISR
ncbi:MAG TPA: hypothetical protein VN282_26635 [Pyrinomonadaceae bacterium]|nr:hypothetical protein [Pyrinomonadaceae bacterium]